MSGKRDYYDYTLVMRLMDFYSSAYPNRKISELEKQERFDAAQALREKSDLHERNLTYGSLDTLRARFIIGVDTIAITSDNFVILSIRSKKQFIATGSELPGLLSRSVNVPQLRLHMSTAENMFRSEISPEAGDVLNGQPHPAATAIRALSHELDLHSDSHYKVSDLKSLGWYLDLLRSEPVFVFFCPLKISKQEVFRIWDSGPQDKHENSSICCVPWSIDALAKVYKMAQFTDLEAEVSENDRDIIPGVPNTGVVWASNHAKTSMLLALAHSFDVVVLNKKIGRLIKKIPQVPTN